MLALKVHSYGNQHAQPFNRAAYLSRFIALKTLKNRDFTRVYFSHHFCYFNARADGKTLESRN